MSFDTVESSRTKGNPVELYLFRYGDVSGAHFAYTNAEQPIDYIVGATNITFAPIAIQRSEISSSGSLDKSRLTVRTSHNSELAVFFALYPPSQEVSLTVFEGHLSDETFHIIWVGRVLGSSQEVNETVYSCEPASTSLKRTGLKRNYQHGCPHVLYGPQCRASSVGRTSTTSVSAVSGAIVNLAGGWFTEGNLQQFVNGTFYWSATDGRSEIRTIIKILDGGASILLSGPAPTLAAGMTVELKFGCKHTVEDCENVFANVQNFGGQPYIPLKNPIGIVNNFN